MSFVHSFSSPVSLPSTSCWAGGSEIVEGRDARRCVIGREPAGMHRVLHHADAQTCQRLVEVPPVILGSPLNAGRVARIQPGHDIEHLRGVGGVARQDAAVVVPHLQSTLTVWTLRLDSELTWDGDTFGSIPSPASERHGIELANYYHPFRWLTLDADASWSRARYRDTNPAGQYVPEAVETVVSAGVTVDNYHRTLGSLRWRYFGPRALIEDNSQRSPSTSLIEGEVGYQFTRHVRLVAAVFNLLDSKVSDVDYFFASRLWGEPAEGAERRCDVA